MEGKLDEGNLKRLKEICRRLRYLILTSTTKAGSGHPTSSLSAVELMSVLFFNGFFHYRKNLAKDFLNDEIIFSKGHASPLLYSLLALSEIIEFDELNSLRQFNSKLEGHPTPRLDFIKVATGSLGQGLSIGAGMALAKKLRFKKNNLSLKRLSKIWVLLGDSEMAEGQIWEAISWAVYNQLSNLVAIIDVNRLGQCGSTMFGWDLKNYQKKAESFGWLTFTIEDGHNLEAINEVFGLIEKDESLIPKIIFAKTIKGKGVSFLEDQENWHGKALNDKELEKALKELGPVKLKKENLGFNNLNNNNDSLVNKEKEAKLKNILSVLKKYE